MNQIAVADLARHCRSSRALLLDVRDPWEAELAALQLPDVPHKHIPLSDIRAVKVVDVHPTRDFGGWGWRWAGDGRSGIVLQVGPGIEVTQSSGRRFIVTVDDATTGAGVLAALIRRNARS